MDEFRRIILELQNRVEKLEKGIFIKKIKIPIDGFFGVQQLSADPTGGDLFEGRVWENTTTHHLKMYLNGSVQTIL